MVTLRHISAEDTTHRNSIRDLVNRTKDEFVGWDEYVTDGELDDDFFRNYKTDSVIGAFDDDAIVGFVCYDVDPDRDDIPDASDAIYLSLIVVDKQYQGQGIGQRLIQAVLDIGERNALPVIFGTWESNETQIYIARKYGFEQYASKENHRHNGEDTL